MTACSLGHRYASLCTRVQHAVVPKQGIAGIGLWSPIMRSSTRQRLCLTLTAAFYQHRQHSCVLLLSSQLILQFNHIMTACYCRSWT